eukprot:4460192-Amphidinium_carterae.2
MYFTRTIHQHFKPATNAQNQKTFRTVFQLDHDDDDDDDDDDDINGNNGGNKPLPPALLCANGSGAFQLAFGSA